MDTIFQQSTLETPRKPSELSRYVNCLFESIERNVESKQAARLRIGLYKYLIREIYPLSIFARWRYPDDDVLCTPRIGDQGHDAVITGIAGEPIESVEVTWPEDGKQANDEARSLNERGYTEVIGGDVSDGRSVTIGRIIQAAVRKATIDYGDASLLIVFDLYPAFFLDEPDARRDLQLLMAGLRKVNYKVRSVFLVLLPIDYSTHHLGSPILVVKDDQRTENAKPHVAADPPLPRRLWYS